MEVGRNSEAGRAKRGKDVGGKRVGNGRIRIGDKWWKWNEEKKVLKDERGNIRKAVTEEKEG